MKALAALLLLAFTSRCLAQAPETLRAFLDALQKPIVVDADAARKNSPKGSFSVDELTVYGLRDNAGRRFCISYYGRYGERWLAERKRGLFVILPQPLEEFGWGGLGTQRTSPEEAEVAKILAEALKTDPQTFLELPKQSGP